MGEEGGQLSGIPKFSPLSSSLKGKLSESLSENVFGRMPKLSLSDLSLLGGSGMWSKGWIEGDGIGDPGVWNGDAADTGDGVQTGDAVGDTAVWTADSGAGLTGDPAVQTVDTGGAGWTGDTDAGWTGVTGVCWTGDPGVWTGDSGVQTGDTGGAGWSGVTGVVDLVFYNDRLVVTVSDTIRQVSSIVVVDVVDIVIGVVGG